MNAELILDKITLGDTLAVDPDVGAPYRCSVADVDRSEEVVTVRIPTARGTRSRQWSAVELVEWYVRGQLVIDPPEYRPQSRRSRV